jgi:hypothetical protein
MCNVQFFYLNTKMQIFCILRKKAMEPPPPLPSDETIGDDERGTVRASSGPWLLLVSQQAESVVLFLSTPRAVCTPAACMPAACARGLQGSHLQPVMSGKEPITEDTIPSMPLKLIITILYILYRAG